MAQGTPLVSVDILLDPSLRNLDGKDEEVHPEQREEQATDGTPCGTLRYPEIRIKAVRGQAVPAADAFAGVRHAKLIRWRVNGALAPHVLLWFTPKRLVQAADADGLAAVLHAAETGCPGAPLILLTHSVNSECKRAAAAAAAAGGDASAAAAAAAAAAGLHSNEAEHMQQRLRELAAELAVWRPDVIFHNASSSKDAAEHVWRLSRAVGKLQAGCKRTDDLTYLAAQLQSRVATERHNMLEQVMQRKHVKPGGPKAALMRAVAALPALNDDGDPNGRRVAAEAAYAVANQYKSLQTLIEAAERDPEQTLSVIADLPAPNEPVGLATARGILAGLGLP